MSRLLDLLKVNALSTDRKEQKKAAIILLTLGAIAIVIFFLTGLI